MTNLIGQLEGTIYDLEPVAAGYSARLWGHKTAVPKCALIGNCLDAVFTTKRRSGLSFESAYSTSSKMV